MITAAAKIGRVSNRLAWARFRRPARTPASGVTPSRGPAFHFTPSFDVVTTAVAAIWTMARIRVKASMMNSGVMVTVWSPYPCR